VHIHPALEKYYKLCLKQVATTTTTPNIYTSIVNGNTTTTTITSPNINASTTTTIVFGNTTTTTTTAAGSSEDLKPYDLQMIFSLQDPDIYPEPAFFAKKEAFFSVGVLVSSRDDVERWSEP
jgi:hypothetical protein